MTHPDRTLPWGQHDQLLDALRRTGGDTLVHDALSEANWYADLYTPWDGRGDEPTERLTARLYILTERLDRVTTGAGGPASVRTEAGLAEIRLARDPGQQPVVRQRAEIQAGTGSTTDDHVLYVNVAPDLR